MTKEEEEGWPKEKRPRLKVAKYSGMSVKEICEALEHRERLIDAYKEKQDECIRLRSVIDKAVDRILTTAMQYNDVAKTSSDPVDILEFSSRSAGLQEAVRYMRMIFNGTDESNNSKGEKL